MRAKQTIQNAGIRLKSLLIIIGMLCAIAPLHAYHIWGGTMSYEVIEIVNDQVRIKFKMQMARGVGGSGPVGANFDSPAEFGVWKVDDDGYEIVRSYTLNLKEISVITYPIYDTYLADEIYTVQLGRYEAIITLPNDGSDYYLGYRRCCRFANLTNIFDEENPDDIQAGAEYGIIITARAIALGNASPVREIDWDYIISVKDSMFERSMSFTDADGDSLVYAFAAPRYGGGQAGGTPNSGDPRSCKGIRPNPNNCPPRVKSADYLTGYSVDFPFGVNSQVSLDSETGLLKGGKLNEGLFTVGIRISEYRQGELISMTDADYTFYISEIERINEIFGYRFYDLNSNNVWDVEEPTITHLLPNFSPTALKTRYFSNGAYSAYVNNGTYTATSSDMYFKIPDNLIIEVDGMGVRIEQDIPFVAIDSAVRAVPNIRIEGSRCNRTSSLYLSVFNAGPLIHSGTVTIRIDSITTFETSDIPNLVALDDFTYQFTYDSLVPLASLSYIISVGLPGADFLGYPMIFDMELQYGVVNDPMSSDTAYMSVKSVLSCSSDPNAKYNYPNRGAESATYFGEEIFYTIAFQNLGNDTAYDVRITDFLDNDLDIGSITFQGASHAYYFDIVGRILTFYLDAINLPPASKDSVASTGFISFSVFPEKNLLSGKKISNYARIYFDQNMPISTNWVYNTLTLQPIDEFKPQFQKGEEIFIFPNPSSGIFHFVLKKWIPESSEIYIFDLAGHLILQAPVSGLNFSIVVNANPATYYYVIVNSEERDLYSGILVLVR